MLKFLGWCILYEELSTSILFSNQYILFCILTVHHSPTVCISVSGMVNSSLTQVISFFNTQIILIAAVQHTISIGGTRANREHVIGQASAITINIVQTWPLDIEVKCLFVFFFPVSIVINLAICLVLQMD